MCSVAQRSKCPLPVHTTLGLFTQTPWAAGIKHVASWGHSPSESRWRLDQAGNGVEGAGKKACFWLGRQGGPWGHFSALEKPGKEIFEGEPARHSVSPTKHTRKMEYLMAAFNFHHADDGSMLPSTGLHTKQLCRLGRVMRPLWFCF